MNHSMKALTLLLLLPLAALAQPALWIDPAKDAQHFGAADKLLFWTPEQQVAGYRNMDRIVPVRWIRAGEAPLPLPERPLDLDGLRVAHGGGASAVAELLERLSVARTFLSGSILGLGIGYSVL